MYKYVKLAYVARLSRISTLRGFPITEIYHFEGVSDHGDIQSPLIGLKIPNVE
jgi:hypothetical protein